jgi:uncharacterized damage-inducible protein DinB
MNNTFNYTRQTRKILLNLLEGLTTEQLNKIPAGFNNNIAWNIGHLVVSTPALCYLRSNVQPEYDIPYLAKYMKGTRPESDISAEEISLLKDELFKSIDRIELDYQAKAFEHFAPFATSTYKYTVQDIDEMLLCCLAHDNMHTGQVSALRKLL